MYKKLGNFKGIHKSGLSKIDVPQDPLDRNYKTCTEWITVTTPTEIDSKLRERNQRHFGQAHGTFPTVPPFSEIIDWSASTHTADLILEGSYHSSELSDMQTLLLKHMKRRTSLDSISAELTDDEWTGKMQSWPESTTTSPSGYHLSHSKALLHEFDDKSTTGTELNIQRKQIINWQVRLLNLAIQVNKRAFAGS